MFGGRFLEHAEVHGNLYGTSFAAVEDRVSSESALCLSLLELCP